MGAGWTQPKPWSTSSTNSALSERSNRQVPDYSGHPPLDVERIFAVLAAYEVEYVLIGGVATRVHGAQRLTYDLDVVTSVEVVNLDRIAAALRELGAFLRVGGMSDDEARALPVILDGRALHAMEISTWRTDAGDIDVLAHLRNEAGEFVGYADLLPHSAEAMVGKVVVRIAGLNDIVASSASRRALRIWKRYLNLKNCSAKRPPKAHEPRYLERKQ